MFCNHVMIIIIIFLSVHLNALYYICKVKKEYFPQVARIRSLNKIYYCKRRRKCYTASIIIEHTDMHGVALNY